MEGWFDLGTRVLTKCLHKYLKCFKIISISLKGRLGILLSIDWLLLESNGELSYYRRRDTGDETDKEMKKETDRQGKKRN